MNVSINTAVFLHNVEAGDNQIDCLRRLVNAPINDIEVRGELFNEATKDEELKQINLLCADNDWKYFYSIPEELFLNDHVNENTKAYIEMAEKYHIDQLKISLGDLTNISDQQLRELNALLNDTSVKVTIENQPNDNGVLTTFKKNLDRLKAQQMTLGYTFDSGNWYWINETPTEAFNLLKDDITVFHLKDIKDKETVMLDHGATDWQSLVKQLNRDTPIFLEYDIPDQKLTAEIDKVNQLLNDSVKSL